MLTVTPLGNYSGHHITEEGKPHMSAIDRMRPLEQSQSGTEVDLEVEGEKIIIASASHPRQGWEDKFSALAGHDDSSIEDDFSGQTEWEKDEWVW